MCPRSVLKLMAIDVPMPCAGFCASSVEGGTDHKSHADSETHGRCFGLVGPLQSQAATMG
jgi:hypothetical protein